MLADVGDRVGCYDGRRRTDGWRYYGEHCGPARTARPEAPCLGEPILDRGGDGGGRGGGRNGISDQIDHQPVCGRPSSRGCMDPWQCAHPISSSSYHSQNSLSPSHPVLPHYSHPALSSSSSPLRPARPSQLPLSWPPMSRQMDRPTSPTRHDSDERREPSDTRFKHPSSRGPHPKSPALSDHALDRPSGPSSNGEPHLASATPPYETGSSRHHSANQPRQAYKDDPPSNRSSGGRDSYIAPGYPYESSTQQYGGYYNSPPRAYAPPPPVPFTTQAPPPVAMAGGYPVPGPSYEIIHTDDAATKLSDRVRRRCFNCCTTETSTWRRSSLNPGKVLCNKCGLFERTHSRPRPEQFPHKRGTSTTATPNTAAPVSRQRTSQPSSQPQTPPAQASAPTAVAPHHYNHPSLAPLLSRASESAKPRTTNTLPAIHSLLNSPREERIRSPGPSTKSRADDAARKAQSATPSPRLTEREPYSSSPKLPQPLKTRS